MSGTDDDISLRVAETRGDFWLKLEEALVQCGGCPHMALKYQQSAILEHLATGLGLSYDKQPLAARPLYKVVDLLAQNGIRMTFHPKWHMSPEVFTPEGSITKTERTR